MQNRSIDGISLSDERMGAIRWELQFRQNYFAWFEFRNILKNKYLEKREQTRIKSYVCQIVYMGFDWLSIIYFSRDDFDIV